MAEAPVAQAVQAVLLGPFNLYFIVTKAVGILPKTWSIVNGVILLNPFLEAYDRISVSLVMLEFMTPILTPASLKSCNFESFIASSTAVNAYAFKFD